MASTVHADRINPTDYFAARDFTLLVPEDEEQRLGSDALQAKFFIDRSLSLTGIVARFRANELPRGALPANITDAKRPSRAMAALRLERMGSSIDASLSLFDGYGATPIWVVQPTPGGALVFQAEHERVRAFGGDVAAALGRWSLRAEAAAYRTSADCADCAQKSRNARSPKGWTASTRSSAAASTV